MVDVLASIFNFALLVLILWKFVLPPARALFAKRSSDVAEQIVAAEKISAEANRQLATWEANKSSAQNHVKEYAEDAKAVAENFRKTVLELAAKQRERILKEGKQLGEGEAVRAKMLLQRELAEKSVVLAGEYIASSLGESDKKKLLTECLDQIGNGRA